MEGRFSKHGTIVNTLGGMCGDVYKFDQGEHVWPRFVCAKVPNGRPDPAMSSDRFIDELGKQLQYSGHDCVHWPFRFALILDAPVAFFRFWSGDLRSIITDASHSAASRLSILSYAIAGLQHCYSRGMDAHQDLKPENILVRDLRAEYPILPDVPAFTRALIADFGLANLARDLDKHYGARPYMGPEQLAGQTAGKRSDVFALGVISFELLTAGVHPVGARLAGLWPQPATGQTKKWTRDKSWKQWHRRGLPVAEAEFLHDAPRSLIVQCLHQDPGQRPSVDELRDGLASALSKVDAATADETEHQIEVLDQATRPAFAESWPLVQAGFEQLAHTLKDSKSAAE
jgi:hypothetical protein